MFSKETGSHFWSWSSPAAPGTLGQLIRAPLPTWIMAGSHCTSRNCFFFPASSASLTHCKADYFPCPRGEITQKMSSQFKIIGEFLLVLGRNKRLINKKPTNFNQEWLLQQSLPSYECLREPFGHLTEKYCLIYIY